MSECKGCTCDCSCDKQCVDCKCENCDCKKPEGVVVDDTKECEVCQ